MTITLYEVLLLLGSNHLLWNDSCVSVPGEPVIVNVIRKTNSLELTWKPPAEPNGIIKTFRLCWTPLAVHNISFVSLNGDASWYEIRNLSK